MFLVPFSAYCSGRDAMLVTYQDGAPAPRVAGATFGRVRLIYTL